MLSFSIGSLKNALGQALDYLPDFHQMNLFDKGKVIDLTFKSILKDLMTQFGMKPGVDYVEKLSDNEPGTDFVALSEKADQLLTGLMEGKIIAIRGYVAKSKLGKEYTVKAYFRQKNAA